MSARLEVIKNGERVCLSGIDGDGVLGVSLYYVKHKGKDARLDLSITGLGRFDGAFDVDQHVGWRTPEVSTGDEITVRILSPGEFDEPQGKTLHPRKSYNDPDWGTMSYYIDAWTVDLPFKNPPFKTAHIHLVASESGPTQRQRQKVGQFQRRHAGIWPEIAAALVRCHPEIKSIDELTSQLEPTFTIHLGRIRPNDIQLTYHLLNEPESRGYFVTLRNWQVAEICMSH